MKNKTICIAGAGSIGCYIAANLIHSEIDIFLLGRDRLKQEIDKFGFTITDLNNTEFKIPSKKVQFITNPNDLPEIDILIITVKTKDTEDLIISLKSKIHKNTIIINFQNGVRNSEITRGVLPENPILEAMVPFNVVNKGKGHFHCGTSGDLVLADKGEVSLQIIKIFQKTNLNLKLSKNIKGVLWGKLIFNLNNALNALAGIPLKEELENRKFRIILSMCMKEALKVLNHNNIKPVRSGKMIPSLAPYILTLPNFLFFRIASNMIKIDPQARSSMWEDLNIGRLTEIDYLNGEIISLGEKSKISTPVNSLIVKFIKSSEEKKSGSPKLSPEDLLKEIN